MLGSAGLIASVERRIVSLGTATRSGERAVRLPLVLGDAHGATATLVLTLALDLLPDDNE